MTTKKEYAEYLESEEWKTLRKKAMERANYKCELCNERATQCHHIKYPKNLKDDAIENLLVCCRKCHNLQHGIRDGGEEILRATISKRLTIPTTDSSLRNYIVFDMSGYGMGDSKDWSNENRSFVGRESSRLFNFSIFSKFQDYMPKYFQFKDFKLHSWKGGIWWGRSIEEGGYCNDTSTEKQFNGWSTHSIIFWTINNYGKYSREENKEKYVKQKREDIEDLIDYEYCADCGNTIIGESFDIGTEESPLIICSKCAGKKDEDDDGDQSE